MIEWLVLIERVHDIVSVTPGVRLGIILLEAVGLGKAYEVQPVTSPAFAVVRRGEQSFDEAAPSCVSITEYFPFKRLDVVFEWWQS